MNDGGRRGTVQRGIKGRKKGTTVIAQSIKYIKNIIKKLKVHFAFLHS